MAPNSSLSPDAPWRVSQSHQCRWEQRNPICSVTFLVAGIAHHSELAAATDMLIEEDLEGEDLWVSSDLETALV
ncbi:hypothetical protein D9619_008786 [Psilocybe cf. subviscida]|uniref:Uncharacterized protein n=1 Tax=Psilocybe cf. subviscida TaxID=2480587 RepID=A0A8H5BB19_9AGAR|nr:hypothetical protein D9619_008786 [Psilocybe cf. subviscida]